MEQLGVRVDDYRQDERQDEVARVFRFFDRDGSGRITIDELMRGLRVRPRVLTLRLCCCLVLTLVHLVSGRLATQGTMNKRRILLVRQAFARLDTSGDGRATLEEVARLYDASQHPDVLAGRLAPRDALLDLMRVFERHSDGDGNADAVAGDGTISWHEFLEYYRELSAGVRGDDEFELMVRNAWHLSGGRGWCANSTCRRVLATFADGSQRVLEVQDDLGVGVRDVKQMLARLRAQGHREVVTVELAH
jgi:Ca2+-binding EF-hand superfamily protein